jgi:hypothetical protein
MKNFKNTSSVLVQKYCRGYLVRKHVGAEIDRQLFSNKLREMELIMQPKREQLVEDSQVKIAYAWRSYVKR